MRLFFVFGLVGPLFYCISCAVEWSFNLPYYLLVGGADASVDQPFVSTIYTLLHSYMRKSGCTRRDIAHAHKGSVSCK